MAWKKIENEAGYPCYVDEIKGVQQYDHPSFCKVIDAVDEFNQIENNLYRIAFKVFTLQNFHKVPSLRICSGVFARHQLSLSEASLSLDAVELEAVLSDIYFAAEKAGQFSGDKDMVVDLLINFILNVFDRDRKEPLKVQAVKTVLILLSEESVTNKWMVLANCASDHNGCVSARRLGLLLNHVVDFLIYLGHNNNTVTSDVELFFNKNGGMLGATSQSVADWGLQNCTTTNWLPILHRIQNSRQLKDNGLIIDCSSCNQTMTQTLLFKCTKCIETYFCEKCYLFIKKLQINGHKETHVVQEITDEEMLSQHQTGFIEGMRRFFFCTKTKKKHMTKSKSNKKDSCDKKVMKTKIKECKENKPAIFTSTVGKASGNSANNAASVLQDIINKLESQNRALQELSDQMQISKDTDVGLQTKVNTHWNMISLEINRLKMLKDNLQFTPEPAVDQKHDKAERPQAFDLFSPIPMVAESKVTDNLPNPPRVLSMDSGNFSVTTKHTDSQNLLTVSGDALKPVTRSTTADTISHVSMGDISDWYHETESLAPDKTRSIMQYPRRVQNDLSILTTERKYAADIRTVETSNDKMKELNADLDTVLDRLQEILTNNFSVDDSCFDNNQLRETANEMEGLLGSLIRGVEKRATLNQTKTMV